VVSGFSSSFIGLFRPDAGERSLRRTAGICGLASVVGVITGAPVGSGIFAVEIIQKRNMSYSDLFPSVLAGSFAVFLSRYFGFAHFFEVNVVIAPVRPVILPALLVTSLLTALGGRGFELLYSSITRLLRRDSLKRVELRFAGATIAAAGLMWLVNPDLSGFGNGFLQKLFENPAILSGKLAGIMPLALAALVMVLVRSLAVALTVGSGQSAGFFGPLTQIGMLLGTFTAILFGFADNPGNLHILQAAGLAGMLASALNVPLAAAVIVSEVFGPHLGFPAAIAAILGFQLNRHHTVYDNPEIRQSSTDG
jgi:CIC family chloride channel protein